MLNFLNKNSKEDTKNNKMILVCCIFIHAAKMDQKYTDSERTIILRAMKDLFEENDEKLSSILVKAEKKENDSNQILEFTKEIKKQDESFRLSIVDVLWKIIYSDGVSDIYETNLMRRLVNLLYITDKQSGEIKKKYF